MHDLDGEPSGTEPVANSFVFDEKVLLAALKRIYGGEFPVELEIEPGLFAETWRIINEAADKGIAQAKEPPTDDFINELKYNNAVFSAFKVHRLQNDVAKRLLDADGNLKSFSQFRRDVANIVSHQNKTWLETEYNTAVLRAKAAAEWKEFEKNKEYFPNLKWLKTTSATPGTDHIPFWTKPVILPIDHEFWKTYHPQNRWNCKCRLEPTDEAANGEPPKAETQKFPPHNGLENNPKDGKTFSDKQPYFPANCSVCPINGLPNLLAKVRVKNCYKCPYAQAMRERCVANSLGDKFSDVKKNVNDWKVNNIPENTGLTFNRENMLSKSLLIFRNSIKNSFNHTKSLELRKHLTQIDQISKRFEYVGWRETETGKHNDTEYFTYYKVKIGGKIWFANVKASKEYNKEVLYCFTQKIGKIRKKKPDINMFKTKKILNAV